MTRRDRYALALALECLRSKSVEGPLLEANAAIDAAQSILLRSVVGVDVWAASVHARRHASPRLLRARLALLLRVLLRVDEWEHEGVWPGAGESSPYDVTVLPPDHWSGDGGGRWSPYETRMAGTWWYRARRFRPLWDLAGRGGEAT